MRILYFSYAYPNAAQPTQGTFNRSLLAALAKQHDVRVVAPVPFPMVARGLITRKSPLDRNFNAVSAIRAEYVPFYYPPKVMRDRFDEFLWWSVRGTLEETIREFRPEVILSYWAHPDGAVAVRAGRAHGVPVVTMVGGSDVLLLVRSGRRRASILQALHQADAVVAVSRHIVDTLLADGLPADKLHVVRRGVDGQIFQPGDRAEARRELGMAQQTFTLISVGRLEPVKGHAHLIDACRRVFQTGQRFACHIIGNGPLCRSLQRQIDDFGMSATIALHPAKPQTELAKWYRAADVVVLPSLSEGVPNVLLEAMSCGAPWIASRVGGIPEIADERCDDFVSPGDAETLANALLRRMEARLSPLSPGGRGAGGEGDATDAAQVVAAASSRRARGQDAPATKTHAASMTSPSSGRSGHLLPPGEKGKQIARRFVPGSWDDSAEALCEVFNSVGVASRRETRQEFRRCTQAAEVLATSNTEISTH